MGFKSNPIRQVEKIFADIRKDTDKASRAAINEASKSAVTKTFAEIRKDYGISLSRLTKHRGRPAYILLKAYNGYEAVATLKLFEHPIALSYYGNPKQTPRPIKYNTGKVGGTKVTVVRNKRHLYKHAFLATTQSGHVGVFIRVSNIDSNIEQLYGPSLYMLMNSDKYSKFMTDHYYKAFEKVLDRKLEYYLNKK